jgi:peptide deformylase
MVYNLVYYGNNTLRKEAEEVSQIDQETLSLIDTMFNIMYSAKGIGLAAPQVDVSKRIFVIDIEMYGGPRMALINPRITTNSSETESYDEGCLSLPDISGEIYRPSQISLTALTPDEREVQLEAEGLLARVIQHELDHLNGILFIDHLEDYQRKELTSKLKKIKKLNSARRRA